MVFFPARLQYREQIETAYRNYAVKVWFTELSGGKLSWQFSGIQERMASIATQMGRASG